MSTYIACALLAMAAVTILCRAAPLLFFMTRRPPSVVDYLQKVSATIPPSSTTAWNRYAWPPWR